MFKRFDFDDWANLARTDPQAFEARRKTLLDAAIDRAPAARQQRLRGLQWRVDQIRRTSSTPLGACMKISYLMWDTLLGPRGLVESLARLGELPGGPFALVPVDNAKILPFAPGRNGTR